MSNKIIAWGFSGAAARAIALFRMGEVYIERGEKPNIIIGTSSGALAAPIIAVAYQHPEIMAKAIHFAETLDTKDMFPYKGNVPFNKKGNPSLMGVLRAVTHNHLGWQDIKPLYKKLFTQEYFESFKKSDIKCIAFGVKGEDWTPVQYVLNDAVSLDDMIDVIECSSRIVPFVQPMTYKGATYADGGFISFNPSMWLFDNYDLKQLVSFNSHELHLGINKNPKWDKNILSVTYQAMDGMSSMLAYKDSIIEELYCKLHCVDYIRIDAPDGYTDEVYETDDNQLIALGLASMEVAQNAWNKTKGIA